MTDIDLTTDITVNQTAIPFDCDPEIENCEVIVLTPERQKYLWFTIVLGLNAVIQFVVPYIMWYGGIRKVPESSMASWKVTAYKVMMSAHTMAFSIQAVLWGLTYIEKA